MSIFNYKPDGFLLGLLVLYLFVRPVRAFGAGNIASISSAEGQNWRHGDIEDALLAIVMARAAGGKKFGQLMVSRVYFGNWLRDYSQAVDVATLQNVSSEAIRLLLSIVGFINFGYGAFEFEVTADRLGCYRPEEHIDNPKGYPNDAQKYDKRLRGTVEDVELAIDPATGLKNYIANDGGQYMTSSKLIHSLFEKCIELGRKYNDGHDKADLYEALRLLGTGLHCLEDFFAHSNYIELALIEMGQQDIFPHVGKNTKLQLEGREVYPLVTGTFGGVDFFHSVAGEVSDRLHQDQLDQDEIKEGEAQQNSLQSGELQQLRVALEDSQGVDTSKITEIMGKLDGLGGSNNKLEMENIRSRAQNVESQPNISPNSEEYTRYVQQIFAAIMPAIQWHDKIMKGISAAVEGIPVVPEVIKQFQELINMYVYTIMAPLVLPVVKNLQVALGFGSQQIIRSSKEEQHRVFEDDNCSDPTHSMLSKDHFTNILNACAGQTAQGMIHWVVPQIMEAWDNKEKNANEVVSNIVGGVFHHPAQRGGGNDTQRKGRETIYNAVEKWWQEIGNDQDDFLRKLTRDAVLNGENHKGGVDTGHGSGRPLKAKKNSNELKSGDAIIADEIANGIFGILRTVFENKVKQTTGIDLLHPTLTSFLGMFGLTSSSRGDQSSNSGYQQSGSGYQEQGSSGYQQSGSGYQQSGSGYQQGGSGYQQGGSGYQQGGSGYQQGGSGFQQGGYGFQQQDDSGEGGYGGGYSQGGGGGGRHHGRREDDTYDQNQQSSYSGYDQGQSGGGRHHGRRNDDTYDQNQQSSYTGGREYGQEQSDYGSSSQYTRREDEGRDYGGSRHHGRHHGADE